MKRRLMLIGISVLCIMCFALVIACAPKDDQGGGGNGGGGGNSSIIDTNAAPTDLTPNEVAFAFIKKQSELKSYKITTTGTASAPLATQEVNSVTYKNGDDYLAQASSSSWIVSMKHQAFTKNGKVVYRDSFDGNVKVASCEDYKRVYGVLPDDDAIGGFIFTDNTILSSKLASNSGDVLTYEYVLAGEQAVKENRATESASANMRYQTKAFGGLDNLPEFSDITMTLTIKTDWTPVQYTVKTSYKVKKIFDLDCTQNITAVYSDMGTNITLPDVARFNEAIGSTPSVVEPGVVDESPLVHLADALEGRNVEEGIKADISLDLNFLKINGFTTDDAVVRANAYAKFNPQFTAFDVVDLRLSVTDLTFITKIISKYAGLAQIMGMSLPSYISELSTVDMYYVGDGYPVIAINDAEGNRLLVEKLDLLSLIMPQAPVAFGVNAGAIDLESLLSASGIDFSKLIKVTENSNGKVLTIDSSYLVDGKPIYTYITEQYNTLLNDTIIPAVEQAGSIGSILLPMVSDWLDITRFDEIRLEIGKSGNANTVKAVVMGRTKNGVYNNDEDNDVLLSLDVKIDDMTAAEIGDFASDKQTAKDLVENGPKPPVGSGEIGKSPLVHLADALAGRDIREGIKADIALDLNFLKINGFTKDDAVIRANAYAKFNPQFTAFDVVNLGLSVTDLAFITKVISGYAGMAQMMGMAFPSYISNLSTVDMYYVGDGYPVIAINDAEGNRLLVEKLDLLSLIMPQAPAAFGVTEGTGSANGIDLSEIIKVTETENGIVLAVDPNYLVDGKPIYTYITEQYNALLNDTILPAVEQVLTEQAGALGSMLLPMVSGWLSITRFDEIRLEIGKDGNANTVKAVVMGRTKSGSYETEEDNDVLLSLDIKIDDLTDADIEDFASDKQTVADLTALAAQADVYVKKIETLMNKMSLTDESFITEVNALIAEIGELDAKVQKLISNYADLSGAEAKVQSLKKSADNFIKQINDKPAPWKSTDYNNITSAYNGLNDAQKAYIGNEVLSKYEAGKAATDPIRTRGLELNDLISSLYNNRDYGNPEYMQTVKDVIEEMDSMDAVGKSYVGGISTIYLNALKKVEQEKADADRFMELVKSPEPWSEETWTELANLYKTIKSSTHQKKYIGDELLNKYTEALAQKNA